MYELVKLDATGWPGEDVLHNLLDFVNDARAAGNDEAADAAFDVYMQIVEEMYG